ncbi:hypothetical protein YC2023_102881 [Brassica napus]
MERSSMKAEYDLDHLPHQSFYGDYSKTLVPKNKNSQIITKTKPKIRIIHIFAPEIINTDVKNFRTLVQSLTGKPEITKTSPKKKTNILAPQPPPQESGQEHTAGLVNSIIGSHMVKEEWGSDMVETLTIVTPKLRQRSLYRLTAFAKKECVLKSLT